MRGRLVVLAITLSALSGSACRGCTGGRTEQPVPSRVVGGNPERGATLIADVGCGACHTIPGVPRAHGVVGPPLNFFSQRSIIAGRLPNTADNLIRWLMDPHAVDPATAMPRLGLTAEQARDIAAYLYTLE